MRLVTFEVATSVGPVRRLGALTADDANVIDLSFAYVAYLNAEGHTERAYETAAFRLPSEMIEHFRGGQDSHAAAKEALEFVGSAGEDDELKGPLGETIVYLRPAVKLLAPVPRPNSMREFSTYLTHGDSDNARKMLVKKGLDPGIVKSRRWHNWPTAYKGNCSAVWGPDDDMLWPPYTEELDPEMEIGFYIGKQGRDIPVEEAESYIAGFTMLIDVSARDVPWETLGPYKEKDFCNLMGPCVATPDEFDPRDARAEYRLDGELVWEGNTGEPRAFMNDHLIAYASVSETLYPGDFFTGGSIGRQSSVDSGVWPNPGQTCEFTIDGIGTLRSTVVRPDAPRPLPRPAESHQAEMKALIES